MESFKITASPQPFSGGFSSYAPKLFKHYVEHLDPLFERMPSLTKPFKNSILPGVSFNLGPRSVSLDHTDSGNIPYGQCFLTSLGPFDPKLGGHLILFDLKLVIEFPPGSSIMLPSATIRHGNTPIQPGEHRYSIASYCAGSLLRYVHHGYRLVKSFTTKADKMKKKQLDGEGDERWQMGLGLFSKVGDLLEDRKVLLDFLKTRSSK